MLFRSPTIRVEFINGDAPLEVRYYKSRDEMQGEILEVNAVRLLTEWLADEATKYGAVVHYVSDATPEAMQLIRGFDGIAAITRYAVTMSQIDTINNEINTEDDLFA